MPEASISLRSKLPGVEQSIFSIMTALANKHNAINLAQGFPDFDCHPALIELINEAMSSGYNQYAPMPGLPALRQMIAAKTEKLYGASYNPDTEITITSGATQAIYTIISAVLMEKDEVIIIEPAYDSYIPSVVLNKGAAKYVSLKAPEFNIPWDQIKKVISARTRLIIVNSPHNPTGKVFTEEDMMQLQKLVVGKDIIVLSDEVYEHILFDGRKHLSVARYPELAAQSFIVSSFGKTYHTTGWKMGYVLAPAPFMEEFRKVYSYSMFSSNTPIQHAYASIMEREELYMELSDFYQRKRDFFLEAVAGTPFTFTPAEGAYFQCMDFSAISDLSERKFAEYLTEEIGVACIPNSSFFHDREDNKIVRFCFAKNEDTLARAADRLLKLKPGL